MCALAKGSSLGALQLPCPGTPRAQHRAPSRWPLCPLRPVALAPVSPPSCPKRRPLRNGMRLFPWCRACCAWKNSALRDVVGCSWGNVVRHKQASGLLRRSSGIRKVLWGGKGSFSFSARGLWKALSCDSLILLGKTFSLGRSVLLNRDLTAGDFKGTFYSLNLPLK